MGALRPQNRQKGVFYEEGIKQVIDTKLVYINGANEATSAGESQQVFGMRRGGDWGRKHNAASLLNGKPQQATHRGVLGRRRREKHVTFLPTEHRKA